MPIIYLSPSTQDFNPYYDGSGSEEYYMNLIADVMEPYLYASGIDFVRNTPQMTAASSIAASNRGNYNLHLALHSNAAGTANAGKVTGSEVYFSPNSASGRRAAEIIANNLKMIYPYPEKVRTVPTTTLGEVTRTKAPAVLIEFAYHDNPSDAEWIKNNIGNIAANVVLSLADYFAVDFNQPAPITRLTVSTPQGGNLNMRSGPTLQASVIASVPNGTTVDVLAQLNGWNMIRYNGKVGFVSSMYTIAY